VDFHLRPLDLSETQGYIRHRLTVAGGDDALFRPKAIDFVYAKTGGIPRLVNQLCDFALVYAFAEGRLSIDVDLIAEVVRERNDAQLPLSPGSADPVLGLADSGLA
jgi:type II secretory pathway predicted ATPase ExeA